MFLFKARKPDLPTFIVTGRMSNGRQILPVSVTVRAKSWDDAVRQVSDSSDWYRSYYPENVSMVGK